MSAPRRKLLLIGFLLVQLGAIGMLVLLTATMPRLSYECTPQPPNISEWVAP